mgnify:CR=1 FL=1
MEAYQVVLIQGFGLWMMVAGFAYMVRGPRGAGTVVRWPIMLVIRLLRRMIGGLLIAFGSWIRGR